MGSERERCQSIAAFDTEAPAVDCETITAGIFREVPMAAEAHSVRLAVLIDADNASPRIADGLFEEIAKIGEASVRRIYGDFSGPRSYRHART
jgi:hypothetical protein